MSFASFLRLAHCVSRSPALNVVAVGVGLAVGLFRMVGERGVAGTVECGSGTDWSRRSRGRGSGTLDRSFDFDLVLDFLCGIGVNKAKDADDSKGRGWAGEGERDESDSEE